MSPPKEPGENPPFPTFASLAEAEAYSDKVGDAYYEICYHLEGDLNVCLKTIHDLYANAPSNIRPKMQTGLVRKFLCPDGWPKHPKTLVSTVVACVRFRHEDTIHGYTIKEAMDALLIEKKYEGSLHDSAFDRRTFEPIGPDDVKHARRDLLRLCDWIESQFHWGTHNSWYGAPVCFSDDPDRVHLANIGIAQRHLAKFSERDRERWEGIHRRAAAKHGRDLKTWGVVGKVQHSPEPRTWTHPHVDARIIGLWPLVARHNWTYSDLLNVLERLLPETPHGSDPRYPLNSVESLKVHCRTVCGLTKSTRGKSAPRLPQGWEIAEQLFPSQGK